MSEEEIGLFHIGDFLFEFFHDTGCDKFVTKVDGAAGVGASTGEDVEETRLWRGFCSVVRSSGFWRETNERER